MLRQDADTELDAREALDEATDTRDETLPDALLDAETDPLAEPDTDETDTEPLIELDRH